MSKGTPVSKIVLIGGSAGSMLVIEYLLRNLPRSFRAAIVIVLHRPKNTPSDMSALFSSISGLMVKEPEDKEMITPGKILLAPQNYHLLAEPDGTVSLDYSEPEQYSRPSIDIAFDSFSSIYHENTLAILLSGLNNDGADGISAVIRHGGNAFIQDPAECEFSFMPEAAKMTNPDVPCYKKERLSEMLNLTVI